MRTTAETTTVSPDSNATVEDLAVEHPYYCSTANFLDPEFELEYKTLSAFLDEFGDFAEASPERNLCVRWDIVPAEPGPGYSAHLFLVLPRKGLFLPVTINRVVDEELPRFKEYLQRHWRLLVRMWGPIASRP